MDRRVISFLAMTTDPSWRGAQRRGHLVQRPTPSLRAQRGNPFFI
jgi:hypothetical protein